MFEFVKRNIWVTFLIGAAIGFIFSYEFKMISALNTPILMLILFLTFLKIDLSKIRKYIKEGKEVTYLTFASMALIPVVVHLALQLVSLSSELKVAIFLLSALPAAASSAAIVNSMQLKSELDVVMTVTTSAVAPFTLTSLFLVLYNQNLQFDLVSFFITNAMLVIVPLIAAKFLVKYLREFAVKNS